MAVKVHILVMPAMNFLYQTPAPANLKKYQEPPESILLLENIAI